jgi:hypothetical protein
MAHVSYSVIDQHRAVEHVPAPQDGELAQLGLELNKTYIPYGASGRDGQARQAAQDENAGRAGSVSAVDRAVAKANRIYSNAGWDLVDAVLREGMDLEAVAEGDLPAQMHGLTLDERRSVVLAMASERERLQARIGALSQERNQYLAWKRRGPSEATDTLDVVVTEALREQAACRGIEPQ